MLNKLYLSALLSMLFVSCSPISPMKSTRPQGSDEPKVIYGTDNRVDYYEIEDEHWRQLSRSSMALVDHRDLRRDKDNRDQYWLKARVYGERFHLCTDEAFFPQPSVSYCSGFLIGSQLAVTAGHCLRNAFNCENVRLVFDYKYSDPNHDPTRVDASHVYQCSEIIHTETNAVSGRDFAIFRLDRPVLDRAPLPLRSHGELNPSDRLSVMGHPSGLPMKFADQGEVRNTSHPNFFVTNLDTFGGNSGSAVLNKETRLVEGVLVRGETDFVFDLESGCRRSKVCLENECRGEDVVRISVIYDYITPHDLM